MKGAKIYMQIPARTLGTAPSPRDGEAFKTLEETFPEGLF